MAAAATRAGRDPASVTLVAVGKTFPAEVLSSALEAGVTDLGENRAQELRSKVTAIGERAGLRWHFVGHLQTNKVRHVVGVAHLIHSVDGISLGERIARRARGLGLVQDVLIEVNLSGEKTKHGVAAGSAVDLGRAVADLDGVRVRGVMAIPPEPARPEDSVPAFERLATLGGELAGAVAGATDLSMGMTRDFEVAIEHGATIVRVGEAIFGPRFP